MFEAGVAWTKPAIQCVRGGCLPCGRDQSTRWLCAAACTTLSSSDRQVNRTVRTKLAGKKPRDICSLGFGQALRNAAGRELLNNRIGLLSFPSRSIFG